jgi:C4-dicarboxylate-specific signal transduction histidine kinase
MPIQTEEMKRIRMVRLNVVQLSALRAHLRSVLEHHEMRIAYYLELAVGLVLVAGATAPLCGLLGIYLLRRERDSQRARELQMELMHVQRLAIMGETSAMLAHEINQPLAAATNYISVLRRLLDIGAVEKAQPVVERINEQVQRTGTILRKLRRFIEKRETERTLESPEVLVEDAITLLGTIDNEVILDTRMGTNLPMVMVDRVQLQQVLVNLMRNAIEAMQECPRRELVLSVISPDRNNVEISLADTGPGLPLHVSERLFQPFVSTKQSGMGVGLSICRSIIEQHNGRIWAESSPDGGTVFRFTLPAAEERAAA